MLKALVIGNGESRKHLNLETYRSEYSLIGCNAIHRDMAVDHLICCDRRMAEEATKNPQIKPSQIYVRPDWFHYFRKTLKNKNVNCLPELPYQGATKADQPINWGSGCYAVLLAAHLGFKEITLVGFDLYPTDKHVNNIYKGTTNYSRIDSNPVDPSYWIYQLGKIFTHFPDTSFIVLNYNGWAMPTEWQKSNVKFFAL